MTLTLTVKWNKEKFEVEADTDDTPLTFKAQMFALTGVQPDRQKIMFKGKVLGDERWNDFPVKDKAMLMMMGSADAVPVAPEKQIRFLEDLTEAELNKALHLPAGLVNLGNTCYMNATLQCLRTVPELTDGLRILGEGEQSGAIATARDQSALVTSAVGTTFRMLDEASTAEVTPLQMVMRLHEAIPRFAEKGEHGGFQQQDANECWIELLRMLKDRLPSSLPDTEPSTVASAAAAAASSESGQKSVVQEYMGGQFEVVMSCMESAEEKIVTTYEDFLQLGCYMSQEVKYLQSGLRAKLHDEVSKRSERLNRDALFERNSRLARIPAYLTINIVRFFFKGGTKATNAKILKDVKFPVMLDVYDMCSTELKEKLAPARNKFRIIDEKKANAGKPGKGDSSEPQKPQKTHPFSFEDDVGSNNSGFYELQAVLTHKGRSSNSGHYVAWVKRGSHWLMCDDDNVNAVNEEDVLKLSGGGDWHTAYLLLYGPRKLVTDEDESFVEEVKSEKKNGVQDMETS